MPSKKQPCTLRQITLVSVVNLVQRACITIETTYGEFNKLNCNYESQITAFRNYLLEYIGHSLDDVYNFVSSKIKFVEEMLEHSTAQLLIELLLHKYSRCIKAPKDFNAPFMRRQLNKLENVVLLNLTDITSDNHTMVAVGQTCRLLEEFFFCLHPWNICYDSAQNNPNSYGISCLQLLNCQNLRVLVDRNKFAGQRIETIRKLVRYLPKLAQLNYPFIGEVLSRIPDYITNINRLILRNCRPSYVKLIEKVCPDLKSIDIHFHERNEEILMLGESSIVLTSIALHRYPINNGFEFFIKEKGRNLSSLSLHLINNQKINKIDLELIGQFCPFLKSFHLDVLRGYGDKKQQTNNNNDDMKTDIPFFSNLEHLTIVGSFDYENGLLQMCLNNAYRITTMILVIKFNATLIKVGKILSEIFKMNSMSQLSYLKISGREVHIGKECMRNIFERCDHLRRCQFTVRLDFDEYELLTSWAKKIVDENLDLRLTWNHLIGDIFYY